MNVKGCYFVYTMCVHKKSACGQAHKQRRYQTYAISLFLSITPWKQKATAAGFQTRQKQSSPEFNNIHRNCIEFGWFCHFSRGLQTYSSCEALVELTSRARPIVANGANYIEASERKRAKASEASQSSRMRAAVYLKQTKNWRYTSQSCSWDIQTSSAGSSKQR